MIKVIIMKEMMRDNEIIERVGREERREKDKERVLDRRMYKRTEVVVEEEEGIH